MLVYTTTHTHTHTVAADCESLCGGGPSNGEEKERKKKDRPPAFTYSFSCLLLLLLLLLRLPLGANAPPRPPTITWFELDARQRDEHHLCLGLFLGNIHRMLVRASSSSFNKQESTHFFFFFLLIRSDGAPTVCLYVKGKQFVLAGNGIVCLYHDSLTRGESKIRLEIQLGGLNVSTPPPIFFLCRVYRTQWNYYTEAHLVCAEENPRRARVSGG